MSANSTLHQPQPPLIIHDPNANANANASTNTNTAQLVSEGPPTSPHPDALTVAPPAAPAPAHPINININGSPVTISSPTRPRMKITDHDFPQDATLFLGELEPWMDEHYLVQVCSLLGWDTIKMHIPRPPVAANATRHPNNSGYALLIMANPDVALRVWHQFGPDAASAHTLSPTSQPILLPNSNHPIKIDWADSPLAQTAIGKELGPVDNAIEYSIFVGDLAGDVTNADLMNVFRNPNLGLRGDFPPRLIAPFHSCCNAKVMVDSFSGVSKGYGFVRFTSEADQIRALTEMQGLYCKSRPMRLSHATAKNKAASADEEAPDTVPVTVRKTGNTPVVAPMLVDPTTMQRLRSVTSTVADSQISKNNYRNELHPSLVARIAQLSNTMAQHGQHRPQGPYPSNPGILPPPGLTPAQIQHWAHQNPHTRTVLEHLLGGAPDPSAPSDPLNTTVFVGGLSPLISEDTLRTFFAPFGPIHYVKVPPGKSCGFVQFVRKADAERAIEALSGYSIGGSKVRLSWGRNRSSAAPTPAPPTLSATPQSPQNSNSGPTGNRYPPSIATPAPEGPLTNDQVNHIIERLQDIILNNGGGLSPNGGATRQLRPIPPAGGPPPPPNTYGTPYPNGNGGGFMHNGGGAYGHGGMYPPPPPRGGEFGRSDGYGTYYGGGYGGHPAQNYGSGMGMGHTAYGAAGVGTGPSSVLEDQLLGTYGGRLQNSSTRPGPYGGGYGGGGGGYDDLPLGRGASGAVYGGFGGYDGMDRFGGAGRGLGMGMSNGGAAPGGVLGVAGFEFDDASPQFPAASDILRGGGDSLYGLPSAGRGNGTIGSGAGGGPGGPRSAAGDPSGVDELPGLFSSFRVGGGASDASRAPGAAGTATATGGAGAYASRYT